MFFEPIKIENYKHLNFEFKVHVEFTLMFNFSFDINSNLVLYIHGKYMYQTVTYLSTRWQKSTFTNITVQIMHTHIYMYKQF